MTPSVSASASQNHIGKSQSAQSSACDDHGAQVVTVRKPQTNPSQSSALSTMGTTVVVAVVVVRLDEPVVLGAQLRLRPQQRRRLLAPAHTDNHPAGEQRAAQPERRGGACCDPSHDLPAPRPRIYHAQRVCARQPRPTTPRPTDKTAPPNCWHGSTHRRDQRVHLGVAPRRLEVHVPVGSPRRAHGHRRHRGDLQSVRACSSASVGQPQSGTEQRAGLADIPEFYHDKNRR
jgi:hypothetical protein